MKVLKNFGCNGIKKKAGQMLSDEDKKIIGKEFGEQLLKDDFIMMSGKEAPKAELKKPAKKELKKYKEEKLKKEEK